MFKYCQYLLKSLRISALFILVICSISGCGNRVYSTVNEHKLIVAAQVGQKHQLIAQKGTGFSGLPILVSSRFVIMPDRREEFIKLISEAVAQVRMEPGNISYSLYEEVNYPNSFLIFEEWKSRQSLNDFVAQEYNTNLEQKIREVSTEEPSFKVYHFQAIDFKL